ncbi:MAG: hypothetical protein A2083_00890 [Gemmatimonadetes bacterium GWC2_71_9]|nr:MAG: hypothetical protein A2083_00890 [Gemmatimonadetes bacterium GWC2_71_9]
MRSLTLALALAVTVLSCGGSGLSADPPSGTASDPGFLSIPLTDVRTGERFTLGGFPGKVTFFIAMAVW